MNRPVVIEEKVKKRLVELERVLGELYQVLGVLADYADVYDHPDVQRALDNAARGRMIHRDLLPWPKTPLPMLYRGPDPTTDDDKAAPRESVDAMSIKEFCKRHGISESWFYQLQREGKAPRTIKIGKRTLITPDAAAEWRRDHEG